MSEHHKKKKGNTFVDLLIHYKLMIFKFVPQAHTIFLNFRTTSCYFIQPLSCLSHRYIMWHLLSKHTHSSRSPLPIPLPPEDKKKKALLFPS